jgi:predicted ester cyclase
MTRETNKQVVLRFYEEFMALQKPEVAKEIISADWVNHDPALPPFKGVEGAIALLDMFRSPTSDPTLTCNHILADGDLVAVHMTLGGVNTGELIGQPATGRRFSYNLMAIHRVVNGKITDSWVTADLLSLLRQLGVIPAPAMH